MGWKVPNIFWFANAVESFYTKMICQISLHIFKGHNEETPPPLSSDPIKIQTVRPKQLFSYLLIIYPMFWSRKKKEFMKSAEHKTKPQIAFLLVI